MKNRSEAYPVVENDNPVNAVVVLGGASAGDSGLCGESNFGAANCSCNRSGNTLKCK